jgi:hypothetical protein
MTREEKLPTLEEMLASPLTSYRAKEYLTAALGRDPVKIANEVELLAAVLTARAADAAMTHDDSLARAVEYLGAVEVAPGRYAFRAFGEGPWKIADHLETWPINENSTPAYRVEMPSWWSPEHRTTERCPHGKLAAQACRYTACGMGENATEWVRITADLATGEEIPT